MLLASNIIYIVHQPVMLTPIQR